MALLDLCLRTLGHISGGRAGMAIDHAIKNAVADLNDRGDDGKPRVVTIKLTLLKHENGLVDADVQAAVATPPFRTPATMGRIKQDGRKVNLVFSEMAPDDPDQASLPFESEDDQ